MEVTSYAGGKVAVFGLGKSGLSASRALVAGGAQVFAWDDNAERRTAALHFEVPLSNLYAASWDQFSALVLSPGIPLNFPDPHPLVVCARHAGCEIIGDVELFARERPAGRIAAITGTNGKSTTTVLAGHLLESSGISVAVGGNVGIPILDLPRMPSAGAYVIELSSYQIDLAPSLMADVAVLLNLSPDHLERHGNMAGYIAAKKRLLDRQHPNQISIVGMDDVESRAIYDGLKLSGRARAVAISASGVPDADVFVRDGLLHDCTEGASDSQPLVDLRQALDLKGIHNWQNAAAAYAVARSLGCSPGDAASALLSFPGLEHRMEEIGDVAGIRFVNDSKATNLDAAARALSYYDNILWIAGGQEKKGEFQSLKQYLPRVSHAFLIGESAETFADALKGQVSTTISKDLESAVPEAHALAMFRDRRDSVILLSPACASFDQFKDFEARGNRFKELVRALSALHDDLDIVHPQGGTQ